MRLSPASLGVVSRSAGHGLSGGYSGRWRRGVSGPPGALCVRRKIAAVTSVGGLISLRMLSGWRSAHLPQGKPICEGIDPLLRELRVPKPGVRLVELADDEVDGDALEKRNLAFLAPPIQHHSHLLTISLQHISGKSLFLMLGATFLERTTLSPTKSSEYEGIKPTILIQAPVKQSRRTSTVEKKRTGKNRPLFQTCSSPSLPK